ncbi:MAG: transcriptional repressor [Erysipelothrix sp.]|nr:transcriptional repressor [Erysipelothrix sp.]
MKSISSRTLLDNANLKYSRQREGLLDILKEQKTPITIEQLDELVRTKKLSINLSTIYRILDVFSKHEMIEKTFNITMQSYVIELKHPHHRHYLICLDCQKMIPINHCPMHGIIDHIEKEQNFQVSAHQLEIYGYCSDCIKNH